MADGDGGLDGGAVRADGGLARDAGLDAGDVGGGDPVWERLPIGPSWCVFEQSRDPSAVFVPTWEPCGEVEGCLQLAEDPTQQRAIGDRGWVHGSTIYFALVQGPWDEPTATRRRSVVLTSTEAAEAAWREESRGSGVCMIGSAARGPDRIGVVPGVFSSDEPPVSGDRLYVYPQGTPMIEGDVASIPRIGRIIVGADVVGMFTNGRQILARKDGVTHLVGGPGTTLGGSPDSLILAGEDLYWEDWTTPSNVSVRHGRIGADPNVVIPPLANGRRLRGFETDGETMAWQALPPDSDSPIDLWTAPHVTDQEELRATALRQLPGRGQSRGGRGVYALTTGWYSFVVDTASGEARFLDRSPLRARLATNAPLWVTRDELALKMQVDGQFTIWRLRVDQLPVWRE